MEHNTSNGADRPATGVERDFASIPIIDISGFEGRDEQVSNEVVERVRRACEQVGFFVIEGHGVPGPVVDEALSVAHSFFDLSFDEKCETMSPRSSVHRGYRPPESDALAAGTGDETPADLCETFRMNRFDDPAEARRSGMVDGLEDFFAANIWPERPAEFRSRLEEYYASLEVLANRLMRIFALALELPKSYFEDKVDRHITNLVLNHYPPQAKPPKPGQLRRGSHTDYGSLTLLYQENAPGGLQVQNAYGDWVNVPAIDGTFVINLGDMLQAWTGGRWVSTKHRVVNPARVQAEQDRISIAFFHQPNYDVPLASLPSIEEGPVSADDGSVITSGQWIRSMFAKTAR